MSELNSDRDRDKARGGGTDRRTLLKGAAWTLPVIAAAAAAPAHAASKPCGDARPYVYGYTYVRAVNTNNTTGAWQSGTTGTVTIGESSNAALSYLSATPNGRTATTSSIEYWIKLPYQVSFGSTSSGNWRIAYDPSRNSTSSVSGHSGVQLYAYRIYRAAGAPTLTSKVISDTNQPAATSNAPQIAQPKFTGALVTNSWVTGSSRDWRSSSTMAVPFALDINADGVVEGNGCSPLTVESIFDFEATFNLNTPQQT
ncbi:MAG: hypothetical protein ACTIA6_02605 [Pseudoclavibacter sp.]